MVKYSSGPMGKYPSGVDLLLLLIAAKVISFKNGSSSNFGVRRRTPGFGIVPMAQHQNQHQHEYISS